MATQIVPDTASFEIKMLTSSGAVELQNTIYVRNELLGWSNSHLSDTAVAIGNHWRDEVMPLLSADALFDRVDALDLGVEFGNFQSAEYNTGGGVAGTPLSAALCMGVSMRGDGGGAPRLGRLFISPFSEAHIAIDTWDATHAGDLQVAIQDLPGVIEAAVDSDAMVLVSRFSKAAVPVAPHKRAEAVTNTIASFEVPTRVWVQRDRRVGHGS